MPLMVQIAVVISIAIIYNQRRLKYIKFGLYIIVNLMHEANKQKSHEKQYSTFSKLLDYECSYESKESTCEEMYEEILRHKNNLKRQNHNLRRQIQQTKQNILAKALGLYFTELKQLNQNNQYLRQKHRVIYETKKPVYYTTNNSQNIQQPQSPLQTPRSRKSITNLYSKNENNLFSKASLNQSSNSNLNLNINLNSSMPRQSELGMQKRKSFAHQNLQNMNPKTRTYGRNSLKINQIPKRNNEQQLTERKMISSVHMGSSLMLQNGNSFHNNVSTFSETHSLRCSVKSRANERKNQSIFNKFVEVMLQEEKIKQKQIAEILSEQPYFHKSHEQIPLDSIQKQIQKTSLNIQKLQQLLQNYQCQIKQMQLNLSSITDMTKQISKIKVSYLSMQEKCKNIEYMKIQLATKERRLLQLKTKCKREAFTPPESIQMMMRLLGVDQNTCADPVKCKKQLKNIVRGTSLEKPSKKKIKIKELLDTIREGRKKFKELMTVYEGRIKKLEKKLVTLRFQQGKTEH